MQKYLLLIIVFFLCACAFEEENNKKFIKRKYRTKPSESMQIGLPKENMYSTKEFSIIKINNIRFSQVGIMRKNFLVTVIQPH